jgi:outer membrane biosynthesis protein TonB
MKRFARATLAASAISLGLMLGACGTMDQFDPTDLFNSEMFSSKKKLPGDRKAVFPEGTPGVPHGVPAELVKGNQAAPEPEVAQAAPERKEAAAEPEKPKAKPKPKPAVAAKPAQPESRPTSVTVNQSSSPWPDPPQQAAAQPQASAQPQSGGWPGADRGASIWPDPPR